MATDQLQGDGLTSNIILLSIVSAFKSKFFLRLISDFFVTLSHTTVPAGLVDIQDETQYFKDLVKFLLLSCKSRFEEKLSLPDYFLPSVLDPRQKLKLFSCKRVNIFNIQRWNTGPGQCSTRFEQKFQHYIFQIRGIMKRRCFSFQVGAKLLTR